jgi:cytochrome c556
MRVTKLAVLGTAAAALLATAALAQDLNPAVKARKAQMALHAFNVGVLAGMAQEKIPYDAAAAGAAANNLAALAATDWHAYFPAGTAMGEVENTTALPAIWETMADFDAKHADLVTATAALAAVAGTDLASLKGAIGPVGGACGACHKAYRQSN